MIGAFGSAGETRVDNPQVNTRSPKCDSSGRDCPAICTLIWPLSRIVCTVTKNWYRWLDGLGKATRVKEAQNVAKTAARAAGILLSRSVPSVYSRHESRASLTAITISNTKRKQRRGELNGIRHDSVTPTSMFDNYIEYAALCPRSRWAADGGIATNHKIVHVNSNTPTALRAPHEALGHSALESALDELAYATGVDPVTLACSTIRISSGEWPFLFHARHAQVLDRGAARFGWANRIPEPGSMRDGRYLIGQGMVAASSIQKPRAARQSAELSGVSDSLRWNSRKSILPWVVSSIAITPAISYRLARISRTSTSYSWVSLTRKPAQSAERAWES